MRSTFPSCPTAALEALARRGPSRKQKSACQSTGKQACVCNGPRSPSVACCNCSKCTGIFLMNFLFIRRRHPQLISKALARITPSKQSFCLKQREPSAARLCRCMVEIRCRDIMYNAHVRFAIAEYHQMSSMRKTKTLADHKSLSMFQEYTPAASNHDDLGSISAIVIQSSVNNLVN